MSIQNASSSVSVTHLHHHHSRPPASIVELLDVAVGRRADAIFLVFEYIDYDLSFMLDRLSRSFYMSEIKRIMIELLQAIQYLHEYYIIHRDLKLSNLLVTSTGQLKLADSAWHDISLHHLMHRTIHNHRYMMMMGIIIKQYEGSQQQHSWR